MAKTLRAWRTERLLSTRRLAELAGSSNKTIVQLENGRQTATFATIEKLSRVLRVEPRDVIEFARAIDVRAGVVHTADEQAAPAAPRRTHVYCVSSASSLYTFAQRLLETGRYAATLVSGVPLSAAQLACARPDVILLDVDAEAALALLYELLAAHEPPPAPVIATSIDTATLAQLAASLAQSGVRGLTIAPLEHDLHRLLSAVEDCLALA